jgi:hypothetical protein
MHVVVHLEFIWGKCWEHKTVYLNCSMNLCHHKDYFWFLFHSSAGLIEFWHKFPLENFDAIHFFSYSLSGEPKCITRVNLAEPCLWIVLKETKTHNFDNWTVLYTYWGASLYVAEVLIIRAGSSCLRAMSFHCCFTAVSLYLMCIGGAVAAIFD